MIRIGTVLESSFNALREISLNEFLRLKSVNIMPPTTYGILNNVLIFFHRQFWICAQGKVKFYLAIVPFAPRLEHSFIQRSLVNRRRHTDLSQETRCLLPSSQGETSCGRLEHFVKLQNPALNQPVVFHSLLSKFCVHGCLVTSRGRGNSKGAIVHHYSAQGKAKTRGRITGYF